VIKTLKAEGNLNASEAIEAILLSPKLILTLDAKGKRNTPEGILVI